MRSELIFRAKEVVENRYKLCQTASKATRRLHIPASNAVDTINNAFLYISKDVDVPVVEAPVPTITEPEWLNVS